MINTNLFRQHTLQLLLLVLKFVWFLVIGCKKAFNSSHMLCAGLPRLLLTMFLFADCLPHSPDVEMVLARHSREAGDPVIKVARDSKLARIDALRNFLVTQYKLSWDTGAGALKGQSGVITNISQHIYKEMQFLWIYAQIFGRPPSA